MVRATILKFVTMHLMGINTLYKHRVAAMVTDKLKRFNHNDVKAIHEGVTTGKLTQSERYSVVTICRIMLY